ncbi:hypothetical protein O181_065263 [Austropuccinia psidii MF-1]|uniref:DNA-directed RNA polymerase I subunit RPA49 n=1 Tax=Austropuccinia psidii MF-1 TaxID=1389203 RepID=A0A9Q3I2F1_9BASI|nr:hypothetical protein [Austropuccinia psidii MF-1]
MPPILHPNRPQSIKNHTNPSLVSLVISDEKLKGNYVGPAFATFPDVQPNPSSTRYHLYRHKSNDQAPHLLLADTKALEFRSESSASQTGCNYMLGLQSHNSGKLTLFPTRLYHMRPIVKRMRRADQSKTFQAAVDYYTARTNLGTTFGTKKTKRAIQAAARNKVDPKTMLKLESQLTSTITQNSTGLTHAQTQTNQVNPYQSIPAFNQDAQNLKDVYPLNNIISPIELNSISISQIVASANFQEAVRALPFSKSTFVNNRLKKFWIDKSHRHPTEKESKRLRILVYINYLICARHVRKFSRDSLSRRLSPDPLSPVSEVIVESILSKFTETTQGIDGVPQYKLTTFSITKLLSFLAALCLIYDDFDCHLLGLAEDLQESTTRIHDIFKSLGCRLGKVPLSHIQEANPESLSMDPKIQTSQRSVATLVIPLVFPVAKLKRKKRA